MSGVVKILRIQNGEAVELQSMLFIGLNKPGNVALMVREDTMDMTCDLEAAITSRSAGKVAFPKKAEEGGSGSSTATLNSSRKESVLWKRSYYVGGMPNKTSTSLSTLEDSLEESKEFPNRVQFVVLVKIGTEVVE